MQTLIGGIRRGCKRLYNQRHRNGGEQQGHAKQSPAQQALQLIVVGHRRLLSNSP
jgi:hypothetical protein